MTGTLRIPPETPGMEAKFSGFPQKRRSIYCSDAIAAPPAANTNTSVTSFDGNSHGNEKPSSTFDV